MIVRFFFDRIRCACFSSFATILLVIFNLAANKFSNLYFRTIKLNSLWGDNETLKWTEWTFSKWKLLIKYSKVSSRTLNLIANQWKKKKSKAKMLMSVKSVVFCIFIAVGFNLASSATQVRGIIGDRLGEFY